MSKKEIHIRQPGHAQLAPSSLDRTMECLASLLPLEKPVPEIVTADMLFGTGAHKLFEKLLHGDRKAYLACKDKEMRSIALAAAKQVYAILKAIGEDRLHRVVTEYKVQFSANIYGTLDVGILYVKDGIKKAYVFDLKTGRGVAVPAPDNPQLYTYLIALLQTENFDAQEATIAIYQPRNSDYTAKKLDQHKLEYKEIKQWRSALLKFEKKALPVLNGENKKPKEIVGDHCIFCPRKAVCRGYRDAATAEGLVMLDSDEPIKTKTVKFEVTNGIERRNVKRTVEPRDLSDDEVLQVLEKAPMIESFIKAVRKLATARATTNKRLKGWKLVSGRSQRKWIANENAVAKKLKAFGIEDPWQRKLLNITEVEKRIGQKRLDKLTIKPPGRPTLVPDSDKRPALNNNAAKDMLSDLDDEEYEYE